MQTTLPFPRARGQAETNKPKRRWLLVSLILVMIAGGAWWWRSSRQATTATTTTATVSQGDLAVTVSGSGTIAAARTVDVPFQQ